MLWDSNSKLVLVLQSYHIIVIQGFGCVASINRVEEYDRASVSDFVPYIHTYYYYYSYLFNFCATMICVVIMFPSTTRSASPKTVVGRSLNCRVTASCTVYLLFEVAVRFLPTQDPFATDDRCRRWHDALFIFCKIAALSQQKPSSRTTSSHEAGRHFCFASGNNRNNGLYK